MKALGSQSGFTLIELLTVMGIMGILAALASQSYNYAKIEAGHATVRKWVRDAHVDLENSLLEDQNLPAAIPLTAQATGGTITDPGVATLLPSITVPNQTKIQVFYDPTCVTAGCVNAMLRANHCLGREYTVLTRFGDEIVTYEDNRPEVGCP